MQTCLSRSASQNLLMWQPGKVSSPCAMKSKLSIAGSMLYCYTLGAVAAEFVTWGSGFCPCCWESLGPSAGWGSAQPGQPKPIGSSSPQAQRAPGNEGGGTLECPGAAPWAVPSLHTQQTLYPTLLQCIVLYLYCTVLCRTSPYPTTSYNCT